MTKDWVCPNCGCGISRGNIVDHVYKCYPSQNEEKVRKDWGWECPECGCLSRFVGRPYHSNKCTYEQRKLSGRDWVCPQCDCSISDGNILTHIEKCWSSGYYNPDNLPQVVYGGDDLTLTISGCKGMSMDRVYTIRDSIQQLLDHWRLVDARSKYAETG